MWTSELQTGTLAMRGALLVVVSAVPALATYQLAAVSPLPRPQLGLRGRRRTRALEGSSALSTLEPVLRQVAAWMAPLPVPRLRNQLDGELRHAGDMAGLCADEALALGALGCVALGWLFWTVSLAPHWVVAGAGIGAALPWIRLRSVADRRALEMERSLPVAMDLIVLCMGAGGDFPGALRFVVRELGDAHAACREELAQVQEQLAIGRTRLEAIASMAPRTRSVAVQDLVAAVTQSEKKGTPLVETLTHQASSLRMHRSVRAEEAAARAGVKLMIPLMMMLAAIVLVLLGPFFVNGMKLG